MRARSARGRTARRPAIPRAAWAALSAVLGTASFGWTLTSLPEAAWGTPPGVFAALAVALTVGAVGAGLAEGRSGGAAVGTSAAATRPGRPGSAALLAMCLLAGLGGWARAAAAVSGDVAAGRALQERSGEFVGTALTDMSRRPSGGALLVRSTSPSRGGVGEDGGARGRVPGGAVVRLSVKPPVPDVWTGDVVRWRGTVQPVAVRDAAQGGWLLEGVTAFAYAESCESTRAPSGGMGALLAARAAALERWSGQEVEPGRALVLTAVLGYGEAVDDLVRGDLARAGLGHLAGASATYAAGLLIASSWAARRAGLGAAPVRALGLLAGVVYAVATGFRPSVLRCLASMAACALAWGMGRRVSRIAALGLAAWILVLAWPATVVEIGFRFSFVAALAAIWWGPEIAGRLGAWPSMLASAAGTAMAVHLGLMPLQAADLSRVSPAGAFMSVVAYPFVLGLIVCGAAACVSQASAFAGLGSLALAVSDRCGDVIWGLASAVARLPWASVAVGGWSVPLMVAFYVAVELYLRPPSGDQESRGPRPAVRRARRVRWSGAVVAAAVLVMIVAPAPARTPSRLDIRFLDVGQGDATLLTTPGRHVVLVDTGPSRAAIKRGLGEAGVRRVDILALTHAHEDHYAGAAAVVGEFPVGEIWQSPLAEPDEGYRELLDMVRRRAVRIRAPPAGVRARIDRWLTLRVVAPGDVRSVGGTSEANNGSLVLLAECGRARVLLTGDIQQERQTLLASSPTIDADVYKVAHHGSATSLDDDFLDRVSPMVAVISAGRDNRFGHPRRETLAALARRGAIILRTDRDGTVRMATDGRTLEILPTATYHGSRLALSSSGEHPEGYDPR